MLTVGFVVEGPSDMKVVESQPFKDWLKQDFGLEVVKVIDAGGNGNMCSRLIGQYVDLLRKQVNPDKVIVLADLDPEKCAPCIIKRKEIIGNTNIDLVVIARKAMESWFLADTQAMRSWIKDDSYYEDFPEIMEGMPWERLRAIATEKIGRGISCKKTFARTFIHIHGFSINRAAIHSNCPSAKYFVEKLGLMSEETTI